MDQDFTFTLYMEPPLDEQSKPQKNSKGEWVLNFTERGWPDENEVEDILSRYNSSQDFLDFKPLDPVLIPVAQKLLGK